MNLFGDALAWLFSPTHWGQGRFPIDTAILQHIGFTFLSVVIAAAIAIPIGYLIGHTGKGREAAVAISGAARALPSFGLILLLVLLLGVTRTALGAIIAFVILGIPSILAGAYSGLQAIDRRTIDAARSVGMSEWQILTKVEIPLGLPLLIGGLRSAVLQIVATVALAGYVNLGGLGFYVVQGIQLQKYDQILGGALLIIVLAFLLDALFGLAAIAARPRGLDTRSTTRGRASRPVAAAESPAA